MPSVGTRWVTAADSRRGEARVALVSLRLWHGVWHRKRVNIRVMGDSVTAMVLLLRLKASGSGPALVAREIALDMAEALYQPNVVGHLPGVANTIADWLSRPRKRRSMPEPRALAGAVRRRVPPRSRSWWKTIE